MRFPDGTHSAPRLRKIARMGSARVRQGIPGRDGPVGFRGCQFAFPGTPEKWLKA